ncbi:MAG: orotate phosphoribosyltransferase [Vampirovibrio sp.]|nr:orotate phosphoribosyltransferase [Vampirovibrio sp.]
MISNNPQAPNNPWGGTLQFEAPHLQLAQAELFSLLQQYSFKRGDFTLASGAKSTWYLDCRVTALHGRGSLLIGQLFNHVVHNLPQGTTVQAVGGMALGAAPLVSAVTVASAMAGNPINGFLVRKEAKLYGGGKQIEGNLPVSGNIILVEDVVTTGGSTIKAINAIKQQAPHLTIVGVLALVDRNAGGAEQFKALHVPFHALYNVQAFL